MALDGVAPKNEADQDERRSGLPEREHKAPQMQETYMVGADGKSLGNVFVYVKDGLGNYVFDTPTDAGEDRPEGLPLPSARVRHARRPAARDRQQRSDAAQHPRDAEGQRGVQQRPADPGHEDDAHLHRAGSDGALQVRRARLDERLRRRADHPYFAVTKEDGKFELKDLPPGTYTIEAWHEKLGTQTASVTIAREGDRRTSPSRSRPPRQRRTDSVGTG